MAEWADGRPFEDQLLAWQLTPGGHTALRLTRSPTRTPSTAPTLRALMSRQCTRTGIPEPACSVRPRISSILVLSSFGIPEKLFGQQRWLPCGGLEPGRFPTSPPGHSRSATPARVPDARQRVGSVRAGDLWAPGLVRNGVVDVPGAGSLRCVPDQRAGHPPGPRCGHERALQRGGSFLTQVSRSTARFEGSKRAVLRLSWASLAVLRAHAPRTPPKRSRTAPHQDQAGVAQVNAAKPRGEGGILQLKGSVNEATQGDHCNEQSRDR